jgi:hypothetical protein
MRISKVNLRAMRATIVAVRRAGVNAVDLVRHRVIVGAAHVATTVAIVEDAVPRRAGAPENRAVLAASVMIAIPVRRALPSRRFRARQW